MKGKAPALAIVIEKGSPPKGAKKHKEGPKEKKETGIDFRDAANEVFTKLQKDDRDGFVSALRSLIDIRMMED